MRFKKPSSKVGTLISIPSGHSTGPYLKPVHKFVSECPSIAYRTGGEPHARCPAYHSAKSMAFGTSGGVVAARSPAACATRSVGAICTVPQHINAHFKPLICGGACGIWRREPISVDKHIVNSFQLIQRCLCLLRGKVGAISRISAIPYSKAV